MWSIWSADGGNMDDPAYGTVDGSAYYAPATVAEATTVIITTQEIPSGESGFALVLLTPAQ
jgi:hypothetical protein